MVCCRLQLLSLAVFLICSVDCGFGVTVDEWFGFRLLAVFGGLLDFVLGFGCYVSFGFWVCRPWFSGFGCVFWRLLLSGLDIGLVYSGWLCVTWWVGCGLSCTFLICVFGCGYDLLFGGCTWWVLCVSAGYLLILCVLTWVAV